MFGKSKATISEHISNIFEEGELAHISTVRNFRTVQIEGEREKWKNGERLNFSRHSVLDTESKMLNRVQHDTISARRLLNKIGMIHKDEFNELKKSVADLLDLTPPKESTGLPEGN